MGLEYQIAIAGFFVGILVGMTGMGGGAVMTPLLILLFGVRPLVAVGSSLVYVAIAKIFGALQHWRQGTVDFSLVLYLAVGSLPSALLGVGFTVFLQRNSDVDIDALISKILAIALVLAGASIVLRSLFVSRKTLCGAWESPFPSTKKRRVILLGAVAGFLVGLSSVGSGTIIVAALVLFYSLPARKIVGTDIFHAVFLVGIAGMGHLAAGNVNLSLVGNLLLGSIPGVIIGSRLAVKLPDQVLRPALGLVLLALGLRLV